MPAIEEGSLVESPIRAAALTAVLDELSAIPEADVLVPRVDVPTVVLTAIGSMPGIEAHRAAMTERFGAEAARSIDRVVPFARALDAANGEYLVAVDAGLEAVARELSDVRTSLRNDAESLVLRKVLEARWLSGLLGGQAYKDCATDVGTLVQLLRSKWRQIARHTKVTLADLDRAERLKDDFQKLLGERNRTSGERSSADLRARAFTALYEAYDHVRQMLTFLRWRERDADVIAPSFYAGRTRKRDDEPDSPAPIAAPTPAIVTPAVVTVPVNPIPPGMPGADPFQS